MRSILVDTNIWSYWFNSDRYPEKYEAVLARAKQLSRSVAIGISVITWGEIAFGHKVASKGSEHTQTQFLRFIGSKGPLTINVDKHTADTYAEFRARLFKYVPKSSRKRLRPEQVTDPITSKVLGIDENDLWIAAQASTLNLTLVTNDKMHHIREVAGTDLEVEDWTA